MTYQTIMVSLASDQSNERCLAVAGEMAERFEARVIGVAAAEFSPPLYFTLGEEAEKFIEQGRSAVRKRLLELEAEFRAAIGRRAKSIEWRTNFDLPMRFILGEVRAADIVIIGQSRGSVFIDPFARVNPSDLVMQAGRPLFVVPEAVGWLDLRSILVAWKDTRETRRAIVDSLPLLRKAKDVVIAEIVEEGGGRQAALTRVKDVAAWLSCHDIFATELVPEEGTKWDATASLDRIASDIGAGVVVAGAYGHSRLREWVLGGVTQHLITESTRCAFLSR